MDPRQLAQRCHPAVGLQVKPIARLYDNWDTDTDICQIATTILWVDKNNAYNVNFYLRQSQPQVYMASFFSFFFIISIHLSNNDHMEQNNHDILIKRRLGHHLLIVLTPGQTFQESLETFSLDAHNLQYCLTPMFFCKILGM